jgi:hypothetical protein
MLGQPKSKNGIRTGDKVSFLFMPLRFKAREGGKKKQNLRY